MAENRGILGDTWAFTKAAGSGAWDAGADIVEGVGDLAKSGYELATDSKTRESAWEATKQLAEKAGDYGEAVIDDPAKPYRDARDGTIAAYDRFNKNKELATKEGRLSEFYGEMTGGGAVEVGSILIPAGAVAKAGKLGKAVNVVDDLGASKKAKGVLGGSAVKQLDDSVSPIQKCSVKGGGKNTDLWHSTEHSAAVKNILDNGIDPNYLNPNSRFGKAFYIAENPNTSIAEMSHYGINPSTGLRFSIQTDSIKVLDLTKPSVAKQWGYTGGEKTFQMKQLGEQAKEVGFNAIRFNSERATNGVNIAVLADFNKVIKPEMVTPISK